MAQPNPFVFSERFGQSLDKTQAALAKPVGPRSREQERIPSAALPSPCEHQRKQRARARARAPARAGGRQGGGRGGSPSAAEAPSRQARGGRDFIGDFNFWWAASRQATGRHFFMRRRIGFQVALASMFWGLFSKFSIASFVFFPNCFDCFRLVSKISPLLQSGKEYTSACRQLLRRCFRAEQSILRRVVNCFACCFQLLQGFFKDFRATSDILRHVVKATRT